MMSGYGTVADMELSGAQRGKSGSGMAMGAADPISAGYSGMMGSTAGGMPGGTPGMGMAGGRWAAMGMPGGMMGMGSGAMPGMPGMGGPGDRGPMVTGRFRTRTACWPNKQWAG